jgi:hypothetical protein
LVGAGPSHGDGGSAPKALPAQADGGKTFKQGTAVATAFVDGCNNVTCDSEVIDIKR